MSDVVASMQLTNRASNDIKQASKVGKPTCLDFLDETKEQNGNIGVLLVGD
jgi:hypothetical protein